MVIVLACSLLEAKSAPFAGGGCVLVPAIDLNVLDRVTKTELVHTGASSGVSIDLNDGESIDELLGVCLVRLV